MTTNWKAATTSQCGVSAGEHFNVVLVYDDQASAQRGLALYHRLVRELGDDDDFNLTLWKFTVLGVARLAELRTAQAAEADLVIVCTRDDSEPPARGQAWFQHWLGLKGHSDCALVVLDGADHAWPAPASKGGFFHGLARYGSVTVFPSTATSGCSTARRDGRAWLAPRRITCDWQPVERFSLATAACART